MQHVLPVRVIDGVRDLARVIERARELERAVARDDRFERLARHELHHDEEDVLLLLRGEDRDDVGVIEAGEQTRLAQQLAEVDALLVRHLQRDFLVDPGVFGQVNRAKAAAADRRENLVLPDDLPAEEHAPSIAVRIKYESNATSSSARCRTVHVPPSTQHSAPSTEHPSPSTST